MAPALRICITWLAIDDLCAVIDERYALTLDEDVLGSIWSILASASTNNVPRLVPAFDVTGEAGYDCSHHALISIGPATPGPVTKPWQELSDLQS